MEEVRRVRWEKKREKAVDLGVGGGWGWGSEEGGYGGSKKSAPPYPFSSCGFSLARGLCAGKLPKEPVWGCREKGKDRFWGSGQEPLIHPRTRSAFFLTKNLGEKKITRVNRLM